MDALLGDLTSGDEPLAEAAMNALIAHGEKALPALEKLLNVPDADHRWWAISTVAQIENVDVDWLLAALDDESLEVRQSAALGLSIHPCSKAAPVLIGILRSPDSILVTLAVNALIAIGADAVPALINAFGQANTPLHGRIGLIKALSEIADTRAIPVLMAAIESDSALMQHWAENGLEKLGLDMIYLKPE